jgi:phosphatidylserine/phosphatidylglycerophosphate/cardiolipin synthase-like enzyme
MIVDQVHAARKRIEIAAAQLSTPAILQALSAAMNGQVAEFGGIYDGPQAEQTITNLSQHPNAADQIQLIRSVTARLKPKKSRAYQPDGKNNIMHNKVIVCDDTVITGSYNFSRNGGMNAENVLLIHSAEWANRYCEYIDELVQAYAPTNH